MQEGTNPILGLDHKKMMEQLEGLVNEFPQAAVSYLGESVMGRGIPMISLGEGERTYVYIGGQGGAEWRTSAILLRFVREYCSLLQSKSRIYRFSVDYLYKNRTVCVIPMLNPDGVEYHLRGVPSDHILYDRLFAMNGGQDDFGTWQANGRGVDLRHNYTAGFGAHKQWEAEQGILGGAPEGYGGESSESEPETGSLCNFLRYLSDLRMVLHLHEGERGLRCVGASGQEPRTEGAERAFSRMTGIGSRGEENPLCAVCSERQSALGCSIGLGTEQGGGNLFSVYMELRELLFCAPTMI